MAGRLQIIIAGRDEAGTAFKSAGRSLDSFANRATIASGIVVGAMALIGKHLFDVASRAVESENLFNVAMGDMGSDARRFSEQVRDAFGLNAVEFRKNIATITQMAGSMGVGRQAALSMGKGVALLAADMASFFNLDIEEAFQKIQAGISGETEPLKRLGIVINETAVSEKALRDGLIKQGEEMSQAQKAVVRYALILDATANAQGDLARTMESPANQARLLTERFNEIAVEIGTKFLPVASQAMGFVSEEVIPRLKAAIDTISDTWGAMSDEAKERIFLVAGLMLLSGPLMKAISIAIAGVGVLAKAFTALRIIATSALLLTAVKVTAIVAGAILGAKVLGEILQGIAPQLAAIGRTWKTIGMFTNRRDWEVIGEAFESLSGASTAIGTELVKPWQMAADEFEKVKEELSDGLTPEFIKLDAELRRIASGTLEDLRKSFDAAIKLPRKNLDPDVLSGFGQSGRPKVPEFDLARAYREAAPAIANAKKAAADAGVSVRDLTNAMVAQHPVVKLIQADIGIWNERTRNVNLAIIANRDQLRAAQAELSRMQDHLGDLNKALQTAQQRLSDLARPRLTGMGVLEDQIAAVESQLKRLKLSELLGVPLAEVAQRFPLLSKGAEEFLATLPMTSEELQKMLEQLQLTQSLSFDESLRLIAKAAEDAREEMAFDQVMKGILATKEQIGSLTGAITAQEAAIRSQQIAIQMIQAEGERLNATLATYQERLRESEQNLEHVTTALTTAFMWFLKDREELTEMGLAGVAAAELIDAATLQLLGDIDLFALNVSKGVSGNLDSVTKSYKTAVDKALAELGRIPNEIIVRIKTIKETVEPTQKSPGFQHGGSFMVGGQGGSDSQRLSFFATPGERVDISTPAQQRGGGGVHLHFHGPVYGFGDFESAVVRAYETADRRGRIGRASG